MQIVCKFAGMGFSCYLQLDTRRAKKNGLYPIIIRITVNRNSTSFPTNIAIKQQEWDARHLKIKSSAKSVGNTGRLNKYLNHCLSVAENVLFELSEAQMLGELRMADIKAQITTAIEGQSSSIMLGDLIDTHIIKLTEEGRFGHARTFNDLKGFLVNYAGTADVPVEQINYKWLSDIETKYKARGNGLNGLSVRLRALRMLINHNRKAGILDSSFNPFENYSIKQEKTRKRALSAKDFEKILRADITGMTDSMIKARKYFLISYYLLGISFHDLARLKLEHIQDGKIFYKRAKTGRLYAIKISQPLAKLLENFITGKASDDYLLPIAKAGLSEQAQIKRLKNSIGRYNKHLKEMAAHLGIHSQNMSSYVARHTLATRARDVSKLDIPIISQMLGHTDTKTTAIYLASINDEVMDEAIDTMFG